MKIQGVQSQSFQAKQRFLPKETHKQLQEVLHKMNAGTVYEEPSKYTFKSRILGGLNIEKKASLFDGRILIGKSSEMFGNTTLEFGKSELVIDNKTGEVLKKSSVPFFSTWNGAIKKASDFIRQALLNFDNPEIIEKRFLGLGGLTKAGSERVDEAHRQLGWIK